MIAAAVKIGNNNDTPAGATWKTLEDRGSGQSGERSMLERDNKKKQSLWQSEMITNNRVCDRARTRSKR